MPSARDGWVRNASSGFVVFLIALPLCLGIAMASGFPPVAGVLTAVVGGILGLPLGSARLTIKGPAAGLIVIAIGAVTELGAGDMVAGYRAALAVGVAAAVIQVVLALLRTGKFATVMPPAVVHGMLAAIGVIIVAKQAPVLLGAPTHGGGPLAMLADVPYEIGHANPYVAGIGLLSMALLLAWPHLPVPRLRTLPAPMVVLLVAVPLASAAHFAAPHMYHFAAHDYQLGPELLVSLPGKLASAVTFPDFSALSNPVAWKYVAMFALVGAVESLLSVVAVDAMDPARRAPKLDRDLLATGIANLVAASIGGLPMISEIVRSKANVDAGAQDARSNFFHGVYLTTTFVVTLATDLLLGVGAGLLLKAILHAVRGVRPADLRAERLEIARDGEVLEVRVHGAAVFLNLLALERAIAAARDAEVRRVRLDVREARVVDHTVLHRMEQVAAEWPDCELDVVGLDALRSVGTAPHSCRVHA